MKKILVPVDGSGSALRAAKEAIALARLAQGSVRFVHAHEEPLVYGEIAVYVAREKMAELQRQHSEGVLEPAMAEARQAGVPCSAEVLSGPIAATIAAYAEKNGFELIVMGRHGKSTLGDVLVGSVAMKVLHATSLPVMLVR
jgi:nucleotide-binding universal stress UspA family protein